MKTHMRIIGSLILVLIITALYAAYYIAEKTILPLNTDFIDKTIIVKIKSGSSSTTIARLLNKEGIINNIDNFLFTAKIFKLSNKLKAGKYTFPFGLSNYNVLRILTEGKVFGERVVIPEGYTSKQIASLFQRKIEVDSTEFMILVKDENFITELGIEANSLEGYLYPNTYEFYWGTSAKSVIGRLVKEFKRNFTDSLKLKMIEMKWTMNQILTLASIIEGEAMIDNERAVISAVYHNRLRRRMRLQADPTIQFIIPDGPRRLLNRDLEIDSPYNTYKHSGLPPGPVNNPGINSIIAAIEPESASYLYFVAKGDGSHVFTNSLKQHLRAKRKFDQYRRKVRREKNAKK